MVILNTVRLDDYTLKVIHSNPRFWNQLAICVSKIDGYRDKLEQQLNDMTYSNEMGETYMRLDELDQW